MANLPKRPTKSVEELVEEQAAREAAFAAEHAAADQEIATALRARQLEVERRRTELEAEAARQDRAAEIARRARTDRYLAKRRELEEESDHLSFLNGHDEHKYSPSPSEPEAPSEEPEVNEEPEPAPEATPEPAASTPEEPTVVTQVVNVVGPQPVDDREVHRVRTRSIGAWVAAFIALVAMILLMKLVYPIFFPSAPDVLRFLLAFVAIPLTVFFTVGSLVAAKRQSD